MRDDDRVRCSWAENSTQSMREYHDTEWGVPLHDDRSLFEFLCLEGAQAGLSWRTVLDKRENYRRAFHDFEIARCAKLTDARIETLLGDADKIADLGRDFGAGLYEKEVRYLIDTEFARTAEDILWRRTKLGLAMSPNEQRALADWIGTGPAARG